MAAASHAPGMASRRKMDDHQQEPEKGQYNERFTRVIAERRVAPKLVFDPEGRMEQGIILKRGTPSRSKFASTPCQERSSGRVNGLRRPRGARPATRAGMPEKPLQPKRPRRANPFLSKPDLANFVPSSEPLARQFPLNKFVVLPLVCISYRSGADVLSVLEKAAILADANVPGCSHCRQFSLYGEKCGLGEMPAKSRNYENAF